MRLSALLAALVLAAPLFAGCDGFSADAPAPEARATEAASAALGCANLSGPDQLAPNATANYSFSFTGCGTLLSSSFSISGDGTLYAIDQARLTGGPTVTVRAANVPYGSFTLTVNYTYDTGSVVKSGSHSKTVTVGTPPPPPMSLTLSSVAGGIRANWANVPVGTDRLELTIEHTLRGGGIVDTRTVTVTGGTTFLDGDHVTSTNGMELVAYRLKAYDGSALLASKTTGTYGRERAIDW